MIFVLSALGWNIWQLGMVFLVKFNSFIQKNYFYIGFSLWYHGFRFRIKCLIYVENSLWNENKPRLHVRGKVDNRTNGIPLKNFFYLKCVSWANQGPARRARTPLFWNSWIRHCVVCTIIVMSTRSRFISSSSPWLYI